MPNRIIKETINESRGLSEVSFFAADLYKRLITYADDYGRFNADFQIILARLYPREIGIVEISDIEDAMIELIGAGKVVFYTSTARKEIYGAFPNWSEHQRIRDSKKKAPDPGDTEVNDYYLRRHIPIKLKEKIIERDGFKCCECGKYICSSSIGAKRLVKMAAGIFHIDHLVPVSQGGRATEENLRLLCPKCNLSRKRVFTFDEIVGFAETCKSSPQVAASCGKLPPNPIQSNTESESNTERGKHPTLEEVRSYIESKGYKVDPVQFFNYYAEGKWHDKDGKPVKNWKQKVITWNSHEAKGKPANKFHNFEERQESLNAQVLSKFYALMEGDDAQAENEEGNS